MPTNKPCTGSPGDIRLFVLHASRWLVLAILFSALLVCVSPLEAGRKEGPLTYSDLASGHIAIGGVTTQIPDSALRSREAMAQVFETCVRTQRHDLWLTGAARVRSALGEEAYGRMLDRFEQTAELDTSALAVLRTKLASSVRYIAFARVEEEKLKRRHWEEDTDNNPETTNSELIKEVERSVIARFHVYDIRNGTLVWSARPAGKETNTTSKRDEGPLFSPKTVAGILETVVSSDRGPEDPPAPEVVGTVPRTFDAFAKKLPRQGSK